MRSVPAAGRHRLRGPGTGPARLPPSRPGAGLGRRPSSDVAGAVAAGLALAALVTRAPILTLGGVAAGLLAAAVILHPPVGAYAIIASTPLIVGIDRQALLPVLRPNEAVLMVVGAAVLGRALARVRGGSLDRMRITSVDVALVLLAVTSSVMPLLWMAVRRKPITSDDVLYALTLWKYLGLYLVVRTTISTDKQVRTCLWLSLASASAVALIAVLQAVKLFGVPAMLSRYYAPFGNEVSLEINRGTSTLASSVATGDVMAFNLAISLAWLSRGGRPRGILLGACALFVFGGVASGQFSGVIALVVVIVVLAAVTRRLTPKLAGFLPVLLLTGLALQPVISRRLSGVSSRRLPESWVDRLHNLQTYFWPQLFSHFNFVLGVRPSARIPTAQFRTGYVWIESGHTWLLWTGGIPFFAAFVGFCWTTMRTARGRAREQGTPGVVGAATLAIVVTVAVLMTFDAHLTLRGSADLLFAMLGLLLGPAVARSRPPGSGAPSQPAPAPAPTAVTQAALAPAAG